VVIEGGAALLREEATVSLGVKSDRDIIGLSVLDGLIGTSIPFVRRCRITFGTLARSTARGATAVAKPGLGLGK